jgi:hypothetical protein
MTTPSATGNGVAAESALRDCVAALQRVAGYRLPPALDRRLLWLSENKEQLSQAERKELLAAVEFAEERTIEKLQARAALQRLAEVWPQLVPTQP